MPSRGFPSVLERDCATFNASMHRGGASRLRVDHLVRVGIDLDSPLPRVPDEGLLRARGWDQ